MAQMKEENAHMSILAHELHQKPKNLRVDLNPLKKKATSF